jgi:hypothetical protein
LAEAEGIDLVRDEIPIPAEPPATLIDRLFDVMRDDLKDEHAPQISGAYQQHRVRSTLFLFEHLRTRQRIGGMLDAQELDEMATLLGTHPDSVAEGNAKLDLMVRRAGRDMDERLIRYFYRYSRRQELVLGDAALSQGDMGKAARLQVLRS